MHHSHLLFSYLQSQDHARAFLQKCYQNQQIIDDKRWSYQNSERFFYYIKHGLLYYETGNQSPMVIKPLLYYYGMIHLIKACLLTKIPTYPSSTALLAHGLSTRKQKKQQYQLLQDEVKIQQKGLFPYFSAKLFTSTPFTNNKITIDHLLKSIPELDHLFIFSGKQPNFIFVSELANSKLVFPNDILDSYHITQQQFIKKLASYVQVVEITNHDDQFTCALKQPISAVESNPFYFDEQLDKVYFPLKRQIPFHTHEIMHHFMLLYHFSMLARYESEWWGDLMHTQQSGDYAIVKEFLTITATKVPSYLEYYLNMVNKC